MSLPPNLSARTAYLLGRAAGQAHELGERDLEPLGITSREYSVLEVLAEHGVLSQSAIAEILGLDRTTILKLGAALEHKGLVARERDELDRRAYAVALTAEGEQLRRRALTQLLDCEERFLLPLAGDERVRFNDMLGRIVEL